MKRKVINKRLKESSKVWLRRQINDPYVAMAKKEGYRSRASFKLLEIQEKFGIIKKDSIVVDLGAAPGGWSQVASRLCKKIIAVDLLEMDVVPGVEIINGDFMDSAVIEKMREALSGELADVVLSDMAPNTCGIKKVDHIRIMALIEAVYEFCLTSLKNGGAMIVKTFQGGTESELLKVLQKSFVKVVHFKPKSSRKESSEMYLIAVGFNANESKFC